MKARSIRQRAAVLLAATLTACAQTPPAGEDLLVDGKDDDILMRDGGDLLYGNEGDDRLFLYGFTYGTVANSQRWLDADRSRNGPGRRMAV